jgi:hypothetical protein
VISNSALLPSWLHDSSANSRTVSARGQEKAKEHAKWLEVFERVKKSDEFFDR